MITPIFGNCSGVISYVGFPEHSAGPAPSEEDSRLDSTTVNELDLFRTDKELFELAAAQARGRNLKMKRLRKTVRQLREEAQESYKERQRLYKDYGARIDYYVQHCNEMHNAVVEAIRDYHAATQVADEAEERADELAEQITGLKRENERARKACTRFRRRAAGARRPPIKKHTKLPEEAPMLPACVICLNRQRSHALIPCGHVILCETCSGELMGGAEARRAPFKCPCCRTASQKLFF